MTKLINKLREEEDKLNLELEESHGNYEIMKVVFEKRRIGNITSRMTVVYIL
jgi:hypothetical protein